MPTAKLCFLKSHSLDNNQYTSYQGPFHSPSFKVLVKLDWRENSKKKVTGQVVNASMVQFILVRRGCTEEKANLGGAYIGR